MTNYGRVNYGGLFVRPLSTYVVSATHTEERDAQTDTNTHTHGGTHAHAQVGHTHVAFVCVAKKAIKIFSLQILFCFISPFLFVSSSRCVREYVCVCVCGEGKMGPRWILVCLRMPRTLAHSTLLCIRSAKAKTSFICIFTLAWRLSSSTRLDRDSTWSPVLLARGGCRLGQVAAAGCCRWLLPALRFVFKSRSAVAEITFCLLPLLKQ